jgi:hypothetical protein
MLGAHLGTIHDCVTTIQFEGIVQLFQTLLRLPISRVLNPSIGLHQHSGPQILVGIPPVRRTRGGTARTQDTFVHAIELGSVLARLQPFSLVFGLVRGRLQPWFNGSVLFVEVGHIGDQVFNDIHVREGVNFGGGSAGINVRQTGQGVGAVDIHGAGPANAFAAGPAKGERGVLFILDLNEGIQDHGSAVVQIDGVCGLRVCVFKHQF